MFGEKTPKTSHAKFSVEFNDFPVQTRPVFGAVRQSLHITVCEKVFGPVSYTHLTLPTKA